jgi:hypothetical protein
VGGVGDGPGSDHVFQVSLGEPLLAHVLLLVLPGVLACFKLFGDEYRTGLTAHAFGWMKVTKAVHVPCAKTGFFGEFPPSEFRRI